MKAILEKTETDIADSILIKNTLSGDKSAFGELVLRYQKRFIALSIASSEVLLIQRILFKKRLYVPTKV